MLLLLPAALASQTCRRLTFGAYHIELVFMTTISGTAQLMEPEEKQFKKQRAVVGEDPRASSRSPLCFVIADLQIDAVQLMTS